MDDFYRIKRLPPYVFTIVNDLKTKARARGEDIIDLGMGNPDQATPSTSSTSWSRPRAIRRTTATRPRRGSRGSGVP